MSEEKMKLCLITTILNNPEIQKIHGQDIHVSETELLEFKFRPDNKKDAKLDENGYVLKEEGETQGQFVRRLFKISTDFNKTIKAIDWASKQINNSIYFINITDHTNDELKKVIVNYYYKEHIEYVFYDTLKTDTLLGRRSFACSGGRNGRSVDCSAGCTFGQCLVWIGGFCSFSPV